MGRKQLIEITWFKRTLVTGTARQCLGDRYMARGRTAGTCEPADVIAAAGADATDPVMTAVVAAPAHQRLQHPTQANITGDCHGSRRLVLQLERHLQRHGNRYRRVGNPKIVAPPGAGSGVDRARQQRRQDLPGARSRTRASRRRRRLHRHRPVPSSLNNAVAARELRVRGRRGRLGQPEPRTLRPYLSLQDLRDIWNCNSTTGARSAEPRARSCGPAVLRLGHAQVTSSTTCSASRPRPHTTGWNPPTSGMIPPVTPAPGPRSPARPRSARATTSASVRRATATTLSTRRPACQPPEVHHFYSAANWVAAGQRRGQPDGRRARRRPPRRPRRRRAERARSRRRTPCAGRVPRGASTTARSSAQRDRRPFAGRRDAAAGVFDTTLTGTGGHVPSTDVGLQVQGPRTSSTTAPSSPR